MDVITLDGSIRNAADWRDYTTPALSPLLQTALSRFTEHGYHGTTIRQLAAGAGLSVPGLYHHHPSKQALLVAIVQAAMEDLWWRSEAALAEAGEDLTRRLDLLVECLVVFHAHRRDLAFIAITEIRSLEAEARARHIAARDRQQRLMDDLVHSGVEHGVFSTPHPREASRAIATMLTGVSQWYQHGGGLTPQELAARYRTMVRMTVGAAPPAGRRRAGDPAGAEGGAAPRGGDVPARGGGRGVLLPRGR
ncbi:TetR/AcrR family transcriptional regulator [Blastococcus sp. SYSU D00695]